uniref:Retrotransposon gag domain-containing protein n=1 Tax=Plectus sambesii TaxID=2011161 RepID=A0A914WUW8_9BILA
MTDRTSIGLSSEPSVADLQSQIKTLTDSLLNHTGVLEDLQGRDVSGTVAKASGSFSGLPGDSWTDFIEKWELVAKAKGLSSQKKFLTLPLYLTGIAFDQYRALNKDDIKSYDDLKAALTGIFSTEAQVQDATRELHQIRQGTTERVNEFAARLRTLSRSSAYKGLQAEALNSILRELFCANLRPEIRGVMSLLGTHPKSFEEAVAMARRFENSEALSMLFKVKAEKKPGKIDSQIYLTETKGRRQPSPNQNYASGTLSGEKRCFLVVGQDICSATADRVIVVVKEDHRGRISMVIRVDKLGEMCLSGKDRITVVLLSRERDVRFIQWRFKVMTMVRNKTRDLLNSMIEM